MPGWTGVTAKAGNLIRYNIICHLKNKT